MVGHNIIIIKFPLPSFSLSIFRILLFYYWNFAFNPLAQVCLYLQIWKNLDIWDCKENDQNKANYNDKYTVAGSFWWAFPALRFLTYINPKCKNCWSDSKFTPLPLSIFETYIRILNLSVCMRISTLRNSFSIDLFGFLPYKYVEKPVPK